MQTHNSFLPNVPPLQDASAALGSPPDWQHHEGSRRVKRAWVIPPISISENHKRIPHLLVQVGRAGGGWRDPHGMGWGEGGGRDGTTAPSPNPAPPHTQIKSDKQQPGGVIYSIKGPGVDEEPLGIFSIDKFSGKVFLNATLDREQNDRFRVRPLHGHVSPPPRAAPPSPPLPTPSLCAHS